MATYFVASGGSNTAPYDTWAKAATSLQTALTAASTAGDIVVIQYDAVPSTDSAMAGDTTYTFANNAYLISASNDGGSAYTPTSMGDTYWIGSSTASRGITFAGAYQCYVYGITLRNASNLTKYFILCPDNGAFEHSNCTFWLGTIDGSAAIRPGASGNATLRNCVFRFGSTGQAITQASIAKFYNCSIHASSSVPAALLKSAAGHQNMLFDGCDFSLSGSTIVGSSGTGGHISATFVNCDIPASATWLATQTPANAGASEVLVLNTASGDTHYDFGYYNALGSVVAQTGIYATGAKFDGTNGVGWQIDTTSLANYYAPFVTPWIDLYHSGTSAITPSLEIVRSGSATAYDNDEVWAEFSYQGTSGSTKATIADDKMTIGGTPAAQTTGDLAAGDWTGENATSWFGKLHTTSTITPAEIGMLRARVCVGVASSTVYVDPYIRVA